jgi:hypothetical protein
LNKALDHISKIERDSVPDRCYGAILGALVADAMGAHLEGYMKLPTDEMIQKCINMSQDDKVVPG